MCVTNQFLGHSRVAGEDDRASPIIDSEPERWPHGCVVNLKGGHRYAASLKHDASIRLLSSEDNAIPWRIVVLKSNADVELVGAFKIRHHVCRPDRPDDWKRNAAAGRNQPPGQPKVRESDHVI